MNTPSTIPTAQQPPPPSDEQLMAYADGLLGENESQQIEALLLTNPQAAAKMQAFMESAALAQRGFGEAAPVSEALLGKVQAMVLQAQRSSALPLNLPSLTSVGQMQQVPQAHRPAANTAWYAMVATVACVAVGIMSYFAGAQQAGGDAIASNAQGASQWLLTTDAKQAAQLQAALGQLPSGQQLTLQGNQPRTLQTLASVRDASGALCREFVVSENDRATMAVACYGSENKAGNTAPAQWQLRYLAAAPADVQGFTPASSAQALDAFLTSMGAGAALSAQQEAKALAQLAAQQ